MFRIKIIGAAVCAALCLVSCNSASNTGIYAFKSISNKGEEINFSDYRGKVLLIVNTASKCGFTPQYHGLETLYRKYKDEGFIVIGFPCDQFGHQEPGTNEDIDEFCRVNYDISFPIAVKTDVNGENAHPLFKWLYSKKPFVGFADSKVGEMMDKMLSTADLDYASKPDIKWNFTKFLINREGEPVARFEPISSPEEMEEQIKELLQAPTSCR